MAAKKSEHRLYFFAVHLVVTHCLHARCGNPIIRNQFHFAHGTNYHWAYECLNDDWEELWTPPECNISLEFIIDWMDDLLSFNKTWQTVLMNQKIKAASLKCLIVTLKAGTSLDILSTLWVSLVSFSLCLQSYSLLTNEKQSDKMTNLC